MASAICLDIVLLSLATLVYIYVGFPLCLLALTRSRRYLAPAEAPETELPAVSVIIAAYNEEAVIADKVCNCMAIDYPPDKIEFIFVSDSNDSTNETLLRNQGPHVRVLILPERRGKVNALLAAYQVCRGDVIVWSDANTFYRPNAIRKLVRHFRNPQVGVVTGDVRILRSASRFGAGEGLYYRYERALQSLETTFWSTVGIDGAMYSIRRTHLRPVTNGFVADDFATAMNVARQDLRMIYDPEAIAEEAPTPNDTIEFRRKIRVVAYGLQSLLAGEGLPSRFQWKLIWIYSSHKLLRWLAPVFLISAFTASAVGALKSPFIFLAATSQIMFYLSAMVGWKLQVRAPIFRIPYYFCMVNLAALRGIIRALLKGQRPVWARTERLTNKALPQPEQSS